MNNIGRKDLKKKKLKYVGGDSGGIWERKDTQQSTDDVDYTNTVYPLMVNNLTREIGCYRRVAPRQ